jgi:hypothetical protein
VDTESEGALHCVNSGVSQPHVVGTRIDGEGLSRMRIERDLAGDIAKAPVARVPAGDHARDALVDDGGVKRAMNLLVGSHGYTVAEKAAGGGVQIGVA